MSEGRLPHSWGEVAGWNRCTGHDGLQRENEALRERISRLSTAILRINETLDLATVRHEVAECACALTSARYAVIQGRKSLTERTSNLKLPWV